MAADQHTSLGAELARFTRFGCSGDGYLHIATRQPGFYSLGDADPNDNRTWSETHLRDFHGWDATALQRAGTPGDLYIDRHVLEHSFHEGPEEWQLETLMQIEGLIGVEWTDRPFPMPHVHTDGVLSLALALAEMSPDAKCTLLRVARALQNEQATHR